MSDDMTLPQQRSLSSLFAPPRPHTQAPTPAPTGTPLSTSMTVNASFTPEQVEQIGRIVSQAAAEAARQGAEGAMRDASGRLVQQARDAEKSAQVLETAINRSISANPEALSMMEAERKRDLAEIQKLQGELARSRRALAHVVDGTPKKFWSRLGADLQELADEGRDLLEFGEALRRGEVTPDIGRRIYALLRSTTETLEAYSDNCLAYAQEK